MFQYSSNILKIHTKQAITNCTRNLYPTTEVPRKRVSMSSSIKELFLPALFKGFLKIIYGFLKS